MGVEDKDELKEELINIINTHFEIYRKYPKTEDFRKNEEYPNPSVFVRKFNGYTNFLKEIGIMGEHNWLIHDENILKEHYHTNNIGMIKSKLIDNKSEVAIREKALKIGLKVNRTGIFKKYNNEDVRKKLINEAKDYYIKNGESPFRKDMSLPRHAFEENWHSYDEFLEECGLPYTENKITMTKKEGLQFLVDMKKELGRNPTITEVIEKGVYKNWCSIKFGSYKNALFEAGLVNQTYSNKKIRLSKSIECFMDLYKKHGRPPYYMEYYEAAHENDLYYPNTLMDKMGSSSYVDICYKLTGEANITEYDKDNMKLELINLKKKLGRVPMAKDLHENGLYKYDVYRRVFNKKYFNDILRELEWEPIGHNPIYKSDDELLKDFYDLYQKNGKIPSPLEVNESVHMCHMSTYSSKFGNIFDICKLLNIPLIDGQFSSNAGYGMICFDKNGELCRSIPEMDISNYLIDNDFDFIKEVSYGEIFGNKEDKRRCDWYLKESKSVVEYFGLFNENKIESDCKVGKYTRKSIKKIKDCQSNNVRIIELYHDDLKNNLYGVKEKIGYKIPLIQ